jgi:hypothetical protein
MTPFLDDLALRLRGIEAQELLRAARARRLDVAGVLLSRPPDAENRSAIERFGGVEVLAEASWMRSVSPRAIAPAARSFDRKGRLARFFE